MWWELYLPLFCCHGVQILVSTTYQFVKLQAKHCNDCYSFWCSLDTWLECKCVYVCMCTAVCCMHVYVCLVLARSLLWHVDTHWLHSSNWLLCVCNQSEFHSLDVSGWIGEPWLQVLAALTVSPCTMSESCLYIALDGLSPTVFLCQFIFCLDLHMNNNYARHSLHVACGVLATLFQKKKMPQSNC